MDYSPIFEAAGKQFNVDPALLAAQMKVESNGNPNAVSPVGAQGLMQIMPTTAKSLGVKDPTDPQQAIYGAAQLMAQNLDRYGNVADAVRAYHGGTDKANWGPKTQAYVNKVMAGYQGAQSPGTAAAPQDDLANDFASPTAKAATPQDDLANDFAAPAKGTAPAVAQGQQPAPATGPLMGVAPSGAQGIQPPQSLSEAMGQVGKLALGDTGTGVLEGIRRATDTGAEWIGKGLDALGLTQGGGAAQIAADKARREAFDVNNPGFIAQTGKLGGEIGATVLPMAGAGRLLSAGGNALVRGLAGAGAAGEVAAPIAQGIGNFAAGNSGIVSRIANSALQGATGAALVSGGGNETPIGTQMELGALLGGAIPAGVGIARGIGAAGSAAYKGVSALAGKGQENAISEMLGSAAQKATPELSNLPAGATLEDIGRAASTRGGASAQGENAISDLLSGQAKGAPLGADFRPLIPGAPGPTLAQATGNPGIAAMERAAISQNPSPFIAHEMATNAARANFLQSIRGTPESVDALQTARDAVTAPMREAALSNPTGPADAKPVVDLIDGMLAGPEGKQSAVRNALKSAKAGLFDASGSLETDPNMLYGVRKEINNLINPLAGSPTSDTKLAANQLGAVKDALDSVIEPVAPGFGDYLKTYAAMTRPIEAQKFLQARDLTDATGTQFSLNKTKQLMLTIQKMQSAPGANPAKSLSPEQMQGLQALHMDLQRQANSMLGTGKNSATAQLLSGQNKLNQMLGGTVAKVSAPSLGATVGGLAGGPLGAAVGSTVGHLAGNALERAAAQRSAELSDKLIKVLLGEGGAESLNLLVPQAQRAATNSLGGAFGAAPGSVQ